VGLYHVTLCPVFISILEGRNKVKGPVSFPPPAAILIEKF